MGLCVKWITSSGSRQLFLSSTQWWHCKNATVQKNCKSYPQACMEHCWNSHQLPCHLFPSRQLSNFCLAGWLKGCRYCWLPGLVLVIEVLFWPCWISQLLLSLLCHFGKISVSVWSCNLKFMQAVWQEIT